MAERKNKNELTGEAAEVAAELDSAAALSTVSESKGGKILISALQSDVVDVIDTLGNKFKTLTHIELIALCAELKTKLDFMRSLSRAKKNKEYLNELLEEKLRE